MSKIACIILAAGKGTRMKSDIPKPLHEIHSRPMLESLIKSVKACGIDDIVLVVGHGAEKIKERFKGFEVMHQQKQLGSGDAVNSAKKYFQGHAGDILVLYSDTPLLTKDTLKKLIKAHKSGNYDCTLLTARSSNPKGYGRIVRDETEEITKIVEDKEATFYEQIIEEINIGTYVFKKEALFPYLDKIKINEEKKEYYLTDIIGILRKSGRKIGSLMLEDIREGIGINSRKELAEANDYVRGKVLEEFMLNGVTIVEPLSTYIDCDAKIGRDTIIYPNTIIEKDVEIGTGVKIGPFAHIRPGTEIASGAEIGNFVELVRTKIGPGCKVKHKTYLGDAILGKNINIGAGTITANYDGKYKNQTIIGDNAFIGVGCILIAPVKIGKNAVVGAGSVVTKKHDVPDGATVVGVPARLYDRKK